MILETVMAVSVPPVQYTGYRLLHMAEGGDPHAVSKPAVHNSLNVAGIPFTEPMQWLSFELNSDNPNFTGSRWRSVYGNGTAFTNENGFEKDGDPRVDYVNGRDIGADLPKVMRGILCSGSFFRGDVVERELVMRPGVHGVDVSAPLPDAQTVLDNNWYFWAINADMTAASHFAQGQGRGVRIPIFIREAAHYPLWWFTRWQADVLPDPRVFYLQV